MIGNHMRCWLLHAGRDIDDAKTVFDAEKKSISAPPTACLLRRHGRAGTPNDRLAEVVILSPGTPAPARQTCRRRCRYRAACFLLTIGNHMRRWLLHAGRDIDDTKMVFDPQKIKKIQITADSGRAPRAKGQGTLAVALDSGFACKCGRL